MKKVLNFIGNFFLFIILLPLNIFKYFNLFFYYVIKLLLRESPEKAEKRKQKEAEREKEKQKEKEEAEKYIREKNKEANMAALKEGQKDILREPVKKDRKLSREEQKEEHRIAKEKIRIEKQRQREEARKENKSLLRQFRERNIFALNRQKKLDSKRKILTLDLNSDDSKRSTEKIIFKYTAKNSAGKIEKGTFQGYSKLDVHSYLLSEGYEVYEIKAVAKATIFNTDLGLNRPIKKSLLVFYLTQLSTYIKAGIPLVDSIKILTNQSKSKTMQTIWKSIVYELTMGASLSEAMLRCGNVFPKLLINMVKTAEMTGDLAEVLDEQAAYYKSVEKSRKEMKNALMYPIFIFAFSIIIITFILIYVIPQFVDIYDSIGADLPGITVLLINASNFVTKNILWIVIGVIVLITLLTLLYRHNVSFKYSVESILMHMPVIKEIIIDNEMTMFAKTFATLINNNIFITDSMDILSRITENEVYKTIIYDAVESLARGDNISSSFYDHWAFPDIAYQMIVTGEKTGQLGTMMDKVGDYYHDEHENAIAQIKVFIEPVLIIFLAVGVGGILLAVILPMFSMYNQLM